jgi:hypothetical protein
MNATCKNSTVAAGEQISIQVTLNGSGNIPVINAPSIPVVNGLEAFEPVTNEKVDKSVYPLSGTKTFNYSFVARDTGNYQIPALVFSYFNPAEDSYKTLRSDSFVIRVTPAPRKKGIRLFNRVHKPGAENKWFDAVDVNILIGVLAIISVGLLALYQWKRSRAVKNKPDTRAVQSPVKPEERDAIAKDPLEGARLQLQQGNSQEFYHEINRSLWKTLSEKIDVPTTELNKFNIISKLQNKGAESGLVNRLESLLNECEIALYTPMHTTTDMEQTLVKAASVIKEVKASIT